MAQTASVVRRAPSSSGLYDVLDLILDKGLVVDAYVRVSLIGIELLTIDLRVVIASVDTYLRFAEAVDRLALHEQGGKGLDELLGGGDSQGNGDRSSLPQGEESEDEGEGGEEAGPARRAARKVKGAVTSDDDGE